MDSTQTLPKPNGQVTDSDSQNPKSAMFPKTDSSLPTTAVYSKALDRKIEVSRIIGCVEGAVSGPTTVFFAGLHGNEPSGVFALKKALGELELLQNKLKGKVYGIAGNLNALHQGIRFENSDLNRLWTESKMAAVEAGGLEKGKLHADQMEQLELYQQFKQITDKEEGPFFFYDLHTTSAETNPFIFFNDTLFNRKVALSYPVPAILGIEEFIDGPMLSWVNQKGYVAVGFESGQHDAMASIENHEAFFWLSLASTEALKPTQIPTYEKWNGMLKKNSRDKEEVFEIRHRHALEAGEQFDMNPGYLNFQSIKKGEKLAKTADGDVNC